MGGSATLPGGDPQALRDSQVGLVFASIALADRAGRMVGLGAVREWISPDAFLVVERLGRAGQRLAAAAGLIGDAADALGPLANALEEARHDWTRAFVSDLEALQGHPDGTTGSSGLYAASQHLAHGANHQAAQRIERDAEQLAALTRQAHASLPRPPAIPAINPCGLFPEETASAFWNAGVVPLNTECVGTAFKVGEGIGFAVVDGHLVAVPRPVLVPVPVTFERGSDKKDQKPVLTDEERARISGRIRRTLAVGNADAKLEANIAQAIRASGVSVIGFQEPVGTRIGQVIGEIDIETQDAIVEVTTSPEGKLQQLANFVNDERLNPKGKTVVLYAPNYGKEAQKAVDQIGVKMARSEDELMSILRSLHGR